MTSAERIINTLSDELEKQAKRVWNPGRWQTMPQPPNKPYRPSRPNTDVNRDGKTDVRDIVTKINKENKLKEYLKDKPGKVGAGGGRLGAMAGAAAKQGKKVLELMKGKKAAPMGKQAAMSQAIGRKGTAMVQDLLHRPKPGGNKVHDLLHRPKPGDDPRRVKPLPWKPKPGWLPGQGKKMTPYLAKKAEYLFEKAAKHVGMGLPRKFHDASVDQIKDKILGKKPHGTVGQGAGGPVMGGATKPGGGIPITPSKPGWKPGKPGKPSWPTGKKVPEWAKKMQQPRPKKAF